MIVLRLQGGLGNQMFQYAYGFYLARHNATELVLDTTTLDRDTLRSYMLDRMSIQARQMTSAEARLRPRRSGGLGLKNVLRGKRPLRRVHERPFGFHPQYLTAGDHTYLDGYWQSEQFFPQQRETLRAQFQPVGRPQQRSVELARQMVQSESVSVHVRRADYIQNPKNLKVHGVCEPGYYRASVEALLSQFPNVRLYIFSDDHPWCRQNLSFPCPVVQVDHNNPANAVEDLWLMSNCRHHVVANSTFSWWGAWLRTDLSGTVRTPEKWFQDPHLDSRSIVPSPWIKVTDPEQPSQQAA